MAEYLELARVVLEKRETGISEDTTTFHLNKHQCTRLWRNVRVIHDHFSGTLSYLQPTWPGLLPIFKEFFLIVTRADSIPQQFSSARSWLQAAVLQGDPRQAFKQLTLDLEYCVELFHEAIESFSLLISNSGKISREDMAMDGDYEMDLTSLRTGLQPFVTPSFSGDENEKQLAEYIVEREKCMSSMDSDQDHPSLPQFYTVKHGYPTSGVHIAGGAFGTVYKVNWLGMTCAKKHFHASVDENLMKEFMKEVNALGPLNNPHIVKLLCTSDKTSEASFLMEHMPMSLHTFITERWKNLEGTEPFTIPAVVDIMQQIVRGMEYLHEQDIVHRDLKSSNILVAPSADEKLQGEGYADVKLADFGLAKVKVRDNTRPTRKMMGTTNWRAPEAFFSEKINWKKADVYSFAMICSELLIGEIPFNSVERAKLYVHINAGERPELPSTCPKLLASLLQDCWKSKPRGRPTFTQIREKLTTIKGCLLKGSDTEGALRETVSPSIRSRGKSNSRGVRIRVLITNTVEPLESLKALGFTRRQNIFIVIFIVLALFCFGI